MKVLFCTCALICATATGSMAQSVIGTWTCARESVDNSAISNVTFDTDGRLNALVNLTFLGLDQEVFAQARYQSDYRFENGQLADTPVRATLNAFTVDGADARQSEHATRLRNSLLQGADGAAPVTFPSETRMVISPDGGAINCVRMGG
ncbi:hypothetical protein PJL69_05585 [Shimia sp. MMG029]|nr:hypothetical protein [Shimia sp. MMG029]